MVHRVPLFLPLLYPDLIWRISTLEKEIYLTFDDGPVPGPTDFVLDTLKKYGCKATFFCIGDNVRKYPEVFKKVLDENHVIGNHTFNHLKGWSTPLAKYVPVRFGVVNCIGRNFKNRSMLDCKTLFAR